jgi:hypothetical protein
MYKIFYLILLLSLSSSCGLDCIDNKTGLHKCSQTIKKANENKVFQFEVFTDKKIFQLDNNRVFKINNAWVENGWTYECIDNKAILKKDTFLQFVIDGEYVAKDDSLNYVLWVKDTSTGVYLGSPLSFLYFGEDTIILNLMKNKELLSKNHIFVSQLKFYRKPS